MIRKALLIAAGLIFAAFLAYLARDIIQEWVVVPLLWLFWIAGMVYRLLPEAVYWLFILFLFAYWAASSLSRRRIKARPYLGPDRSYPSPLQSWKGKLDRATQGSYSSWYLASNLADLWIDLITDQAKISPVEAKRILEKGTPEMPPEIRAYLQAGINRHINLGKDSLLMRLLGLRRKSELDLDPLIVVEFLEKELSNNKI
jgi:hypothetical protein